MGNPPFVGARLMSPVQKEDVAEIFKDIKKDKFYTYDDYLKEDVLLSTTETKGTYIHKGDKICQFRIMEIQPEIEFEKVEHLEGKDRGGFGSTGSK